MHYITAIRKETRLNAKHLTHALRTRWKQHTTPERSILLLTLISTATMGILLLAPLYHRLPSSNMTWSIPKQPKAPQKITQTKKTPPPLDLNPVRAEPKHFPKNTWWPKVRERDASGPIHQIPFNAERDLITIHDKRVWWESDNDDASGDTENDHLMHRCMHDPFKRLVDLVEKEAAKTSKGVILKVQDSYREKKVHGIRSLHKQGRGLDITTGQPNALRTPGIPLSKLAKLCWAAGFDWVYYETSGGHHVHVSKRP